MERKATSPVKGYRTQDGAGVSLVRVLGNQTTDVYDPILMLDSFDSTRPEDYTAGFPLHPHRGIETISYVYRGQMTHRDSLGNEDTIRDGEVQWMTAGSGILHEEMLPPSERMLGVQLWLNLPKKDKMAPPAYHSIKNSEIQEIPFEGGKLRLLCGQYAGHRGYESSYLPLDYYDIHLSQGASLRLETEEERSILLFTLLGSVKVAGETIPEKTAVKLTQGDSVSLTAGKEPAQVLFVSSRRLDEPIAWGGPIVMNTEGELRLAFDELRRGAFLKQGIEY